MGKGQGGGGGAWQPDGDAILRFGGFHVAKALARGFGGGRARIHKRGGKECQAAALALPLHLPPKVAEPPTPRRSCVRHCGHWRHGWTKVSRFVTCIV